MAAAADADVVVVILGHGTLSIATGDCGEEMERVGARVLQCPCCGVRRRCAPLPRVLTLDEARMQVREEEEE